MKAKNRCESIKRQIVDGVTARYCEILLGSTLAKSLYTLLLVVATNSPDKLLPGVGVMVSSALLIFRPDSAIRLDSPCGPHAHSE